MKLAKKLPVHKSENDSYIIRDYTRNGSGSPVITLRKEFLMANHLEPGDEVSVFLDRDNNLVIVPTHRSMEYELQENGK